MITFQVILLAVSIYLLAQCVATAREQKCQYLKSPGNWLQLFIAVFTLLSIGLYVACVVTATDAAGEVSEKSGRFILFERSLHLHEWLRILHACLIFLLFLKVVCCLTHFCIIKTYM